MREDGFQITGIAAHERQRGVPAPDRDREVEGGDDAHRPQREPGLHHPVPGPLGCDREAVQLPGQPHREVADVDHLLHLAQALLADLAGLEGDQRAQRLLLLAQLVGQQAHQLAAPWCRHVAPDLERLHRPRDRGLRVGLAGRVEVRDHLARDGRAHLEVAAAEARRVDAEAGEQCVGVLSGKGGGHGDLRERVAGRGGIECSYDRRMQASDTGAQAGILVTGASGYLGRELLAQARAAGRDATGTHLTNATADVFLDVCDRAAVDDLMARVRPGAVVHTAYLQGGDRMRAGERRRRRARRGRRRPPRRPADPPVHRLRVRRGAGPALPGGRPTRAGQRVRRLQAGR